MTFSVHILRGLPASGKTRRANAWVAADPTRRARVNSGEIRRSLFGSVPWSEELAEAVTSVRNAAVAALLRRGYSVVSDDLNLKVRAVKDLSFIAAKVKAHVTVHDLSDVALETCLERDAARRHPAGEGMIRDLHSRYIARFGSPLPLPTTLTRPRRAKPLVAAPVPPDHAGVVAAIAALRPHKEMTS